MDARFSAVVIALMVVGSQATSITKNSPYAQYLDQKNAKWDDLGVTANINEYIDNTLYMLVPFIQENGLDPMPLPDLEEGFSVQVLLITYSARMMIHDGQMRGLVNIARSGDQKVSYFAKMLRVRLELRVSDLEFVYRYLVKVMGIGPTGGIVGSLDNLVVKVDLLIDFNNDEIHLQHFSLSDVGRLRVRLTGNILYDWLVNPIIGTFVRIFDTTIIRVVETNIREAIYDGIILINSAVNNIISIIEAYN